MKKLKIVVVFLFLFVTFVAFGDVSSLLKQVDSLFHNDKHIESKEILLKALSEAETDKEKAQIYWRLSRATVRIGEDKKDNGAPKDELLKIFEEGESYADKAIQYDSSDYNAYFWKSANIGRWGQTKGILNSLFKAAPMRDLLKKAIALKPDYPSAYYVLGQLYDQVPGFPVSFGNIEYAVSFGRKSIDLMRDWYEKGIEKEISYDFYTELAKHLYNRNWSVRKRKKYHAKQKRKYNSETDIFEKSFYYEGVVDIKSISDRQEAIELVKWTIKQLESIPNKKRSQLKDLKKAKEALAKWE